MSLVRKIFNIIVLQAFTLAAYSQTNNFRLIVKSTDRQALPGATATLFSNRKAIKTVVTNAAGVAQFTKEQGIYTITVTHVGNKPFTTRAYKWPGDIAEDTIFVQPLNTQLGEVSVTAKPPVIQRQQGKVILDVGASVTNTGSTVLEVLERSPGVTVDRNGGISLTAKQG